MTTQQDSVLLTEQQQKQAEREARMRIRGQLIKQGICPKCDAKIMHRKAQGRCVYAVPCGHDLYQGKA